MEHLDRDDAKEALEMLLETQAMLNLADPTNVKICSLLAHSLRNLSRVYMR